MRPGGVLLLTFHNLGKSTLLVQAHDPPGRDDRAQGARPRASPAPHGQRLLRAGRRSGTMPSPLRLQLVPKKRARQALRRRAAPVGVALTVTYTADRLFPDTQVRTEKVRWIAPHRHHR